MSEGLVSPSYYDPVSQLESEEHERMQDFWRHVQETADSEQLSYRRGPLSVEIEGVIDEVTTDIHIATMGSYGYELSLPSSYREQTTRNFDVEGMRPHYSLEDKWEGQRLNGLLGLAQQIKWQRHGFQIPTGLTTRPEEVSPLTGSRTCAAATVATVAQDLTGLPLFASDILDPIHATSSDNNMVRANGELLSVLTNPLFTERYGWNCQATGLSGMDLISLQKVLTHLRTKRPDDRLYCSLGLMTGRGELLRATPVLHTVLLDHSDGGWVTTIEPRTGARRSVSDLLVTTTTIEFLRRWAVGGFQGYIVLAEQVHA